MDLADSLKTLSAHQLKGIIPSARGDSLDMTFSHQLKDNQIGLQLAVKCPKLTMQLDAVTDEKSIVMSKPTFFRWQIDPLLINTVQNIVPKLKGLELLTSNTVQVTFQPTTLPLPLTNLSEKLPLSVSFGSELPYLKKLIIFHIIIYNSTLNKLWLF